MKFLAAIKRFRVFYARCKQLFRMGWLKGLPVLLSGRRLIARYSKAVIRQAEAKAEWTHALKQKQRIANLRAYCKIVRETYPKRSAEYRELMRQALLRQKPKSRDHPLD